MKDIPILMSTPMVRATLADQKTETRRTVGLDVINSDPDDWEFNWADYQTGFCFNQKSTLTKRRIKNKTFNQVLIKSRYGSVGDRLWVRETFANGQNGSLDCNIGKEEQDYKLFYWIFKDGSQLFSDGSFFQGNRNGDEESMKLCKWRPSIHMPKAAARIWVENLGVRVERLHAITEQAAIAEGIERAGSGFKGYAVIHHGPHKGTNHPYNAVPNINARTSYEELWNSINGENSWNLNPWVWVVKYKVLSKTGRP